MAERIQGFAFLNVFVKIVFQKMRRRNSAHFFLPFLLSSRAWVQALSRSVRESGEWEMGNGRGRLFALFVPKDFRVERHETVRRET